MAKSAATKTVGTNVEYVIEGDILTIKVDLSEKGSPSNSGKTFILASTGGNKNIGDVFIGLNVYRYADKKKKKDK